MATAEFLTKRIEGKKAEIEKLEKKLARIIKAEETNWEVNPYYYSESDKRWTERDLESAKKSLADYEAKLEVENNKASSRNVQVIIDFLDSWKKESFDFYERMLPKYLEALDEYYRIDGEYCDWWNSSSRANRSEWKAERSKREKIVDDAKRSLNSNWGWIMGYVERRVLDTAKLRKDLDREADEKYDFIIERTNAIVTKITDASNLYIGNSGELNGYIIGTTGTAKVQTIGAGGYNIQRFHFRTLIHKMK
jgi:hypothetical protein